MCLCLLTTSKEDDSWSVTECETVNGQCEEDFFPFIPTQLLQGDLLQLYKGVIFSPVVFADEVHRVQDYAWRTRRAPPPGAESLQSLLFFLFGA